MRLFTVLLVACGVAAAGCSHALQPGASAPPAPSNPVTENPFFRASTLPYQAPPFDRIRDADYQPAIEEGIRRELAEIDAIASQTAEPTFDNTIVPLERAGELLTRANNAFGVVSDANMNDELQRVQTETAPKLAALSDAIHLNAKLFAHVESLYQGRDALGLTAEQKSVLETYRRRFVRAGAQLSDADKARLRELNQEQARLRTEFSKRLLAATKAGAIVVDDPRRLEGLSEGDIAAAAEAATQRGLPGKWVLLLRNTTQHPLQASLKDRALRKALFEASSLRGERGDTSDTRALLLRLAELQAQRARLMGYPDYASFALQDRMAKTPEAAMKLLADVGAPATARARAEVAAMQALIDKQGGGFKLEPWDWQYYAEQVRKAEYDLDEEQVKPYLDLDRVLRDGVFFAATRLYGITFRERKDIPVYHPDVRVYEVFDADGKPLALFYGDYFKRDAKSGGAWSTGLVDQSRLMGTRPVVVNVCNFTKPAPGQPALISYDDVETLFHEFGHALNSIFSDVGYPTAGEVPRDFVELASQFNEHWALDPAVRANYARHYRTGEPMPVALVEKLEKAATFNQGFATTEYVAAALLDMAWHTLPPGGIPQDVAAFESDALRRYQVDVAEVPPRYHSSYFSHIWGGGYAAGYYAYLWAEVLDQDAYAWFKEHGGLTRENGQRFRDLILAHGTTDAAATYRAFRGGDPSIQHLLLARGLTPVAAKAAPER